MKENSENDTVLITVLKLLRLLCLGALLVPAAVLVICAVLATANSNAGWLRYPLPVVLLGVYMLAGLASPLVGIIALAILFIKRRALHSKARREERKLRNHIIGLSLLDIFAFLFWAMLFPFVIFSAGGTR